MKIVVVGGGWLGLPLAKHLKGLGHIVAVTKTTQEGCLLLEKQGYHSFALSLGKDLNEEQKEAFKTFSPDIIIGCFPPGLRAKKTANYVENWSQLSKLAHAVKAQKVIMISTSGVYPALAEKMYECRELSSQPHDSKQNLLSKGELEVINGGVPYSILRCSGLIGPNRHPARFAPRLKSISDKAPANMVHLDDVIAAIVFMLENGTNQIFNVTTPETVSKYEFYRRATGLYHEPFSMPAPVHTPDKQIMADKLVNTGFTFKYPHIFEALDALGDK